MELHPEMLPLAVRILDFSGGKKVPNPFLRSFHLLSWNPFLNFLSSLSFSIFNLSHSPLSRISSPPTASLRTALSTHYLILSFPPRLKSILHHDLFYFTDTYANGSRCVSARVPKSERISRNERLLTVGKNYLNWNWSFHRPSRRLLHAASSYPPSCRSIPSKSE